MRILPWLGLGGVALLSACGHDDSSLAGPPTRTTNAASAIEASLLVSPTTLVPSGDAAGRRFGRAIASSDDARVVVVGAPDDSVLATSAGAAHVFVRSAGVLTEVAVLRPASLRESDQFGWHVAISGDGTRIAVGAPYAGVADGGAVYVFRDVAGVWTEEVMLAPASSATGDELSPVSLDATGATLLVGSPNANTASCLGCGAAFIFTRDATGWTEVATLVSPAPAPFEKMGQAVALSRDGGRAVVGIPREDTTHLDAGGARMFVRSGATWAHEALLTHSDSAANDLCGLAVATNTAGDRVAIGCPLADPAAGTNAGTIRVFTLAGGSWTGDAMGAVSDASFGDQLGHSLSMTPDGLRLVSGAVGDEVGASGVPNGSVRVFDRVGASWRQGGVASIPGLGEAAFGRSISVAADGVTVLVGADQADTVAVARSGAAYALVLQSERGEPCSRGPQCATGSCVDGVCCDTACGGNALDDCQACTAALTGGTDGTCAALSATAAPATVCRATAGGCDVAERCVAGDIACPTNTFVAAGMECRGARGGCDPIEQCTGAAAACPDDVIAAAGASCRAAVGRCDVAELCDGTSTACPIDRTAAEGTACGDGDACNGEERCTAGSCVLAALLDCDDEDVCTADACDAVLGCSHAEVIGCCRLDSECADTDSCTDDACDLTTGACVYTTSAGCPPIDAGIPPGVDAGPITLADVGPVDAAFDPTVDAGPLGAFDTGTGRDAGSGGGSSGCGCHVPASETHGGGAAAAFVVLMGLVGARRRRTRSRDRASLTAE